MLRFTVQPDGNLHIGPGNGRGAYLHLRLECVRAFAAARAGVVRSLKVSLSRELRQRYARQIEQIATLWAEKR
jgi:predicted RNA-binding protein YlxR (DUF448 family)